MKRSNDYGRMKNLRSILGLALLMGCAPGPALAQDGERLLYVTENGSRGRDLVLARSDGREQARLSVWSGSGHYPHFNWPAWSEDAERIAYIADVDRHDHYSIWTMSASGGDVRRLTPQGVEGLYPSWSPDGGWIAFTGRADGVWEMFVMERDGGARRPLSSHRADGFRPQWGGFSSWSPDGSSVYYHASVAGEYGVYRVPVTGGSSVRVEWLPSGARYPSWSPSGRWLAFVGEDGVYITGPGGDGMRRVAAGSFLGLPAWSRTEEKLALTVTHPDWDIVIVAVDTGAIVRVTADKHLDGYPVWMWIEGSGDIPKLQTGDTIRDGLEPRARVKPRRATIQSRMGLLRT